MAGVVTEQGTENMSPMTGNVIPLLAAENAAHAADGQRGFRREARLADVHEVRIGNHPHGGFARDFATADGEWVMVSALTQRQFTDLAQATRLVGTFGFLERLLRADFSARADLSAHRDTIAALLVPWFARRTVADLTAEFAGTSVPWARLHNRTGRPRSRN
jgi:2-methylfumaryl-CoA isomerase